MWTKIIGFIMSIVMFIGSLLGISCPKEIGERDIIEYGGDGKSFSVAIEENATTGYRWNVKIADEKVVKLAKNEFAAPTTDMAGAPGTRVYTFKAAAPGKTTIAFSYERSWEAGAADTLTVTVEVAEDMTVTAQTA